jgi:hypothetical protein
MVAGGSRVGPKAPTSLTLLLFLKVGPFKKPSFERVMGVGTAPYFLKI